MLQSAGVTHCPLVVFGVLCVVPEASCMYVCSEVGGRSDDTLHEVRVEVHCCAFVMASSSSCHSDNEPLTQLHDRADTSSRLAG